MSGIAGIIRFDGRPVESGLVEKMTAMMPYRGPDGINHWVRGSIALGQCMLRTTPESLEEAQPLANEDENLILILDGRIDNWDALRSDLLSRGAVLRTRADAELLLRAYELWGQDCLTHVDGDFAFVIWDARRRLAFCARDRMGNKPFVYHWDGNTLVFASELKAILAMNWVPRIPNPGMLAEYLADEWITFDETLWSGLMRLPGAHSMAVGPAGPKPSCYWRPDLEAPEPYTKEEDYVDHYRYLFADCVRRLSRSHKPVAFEVSGGLDSSAVFAMAENLRQGGSLPAPSIDGYTLTYPDHADSDEVVFARLVGTHLGVPVHEVAPCLKDRQWLQSESRFYNDFPGFPGGSQSLHLYSQAAVTGSSVVITGLGGDQIIGASRAHYAEELARLNYIKVYDYLKSDLQDFGFRPTVRMFMKNGLLPMLPERVKVALRPLARRFDARTLRDAYWLSRPMRDQLIARRLRQSPLGLAKVRRRGQLHLLQALYYPFDSYGRELCERNAARQGFEIRHPFYSLPLVQFAFQTPERLRSKGVAGKYIHVQALRGILPQTVLGRTTKADFATFSADYILPLETEMTGDLIDRRTSWLSKDGMKGLFQSYQRRPGEGWQFWVLAGILGCDIALPQDGE